MRELGEAGEEGGLSSLVFIDEHAITDLPIMPLASHVRALWAMFDFERAFGSDPARKLLERCIDGVVFVLDQFDLGYWSRADLDPRHRTKRPAARECHRTHVVMLESVARITSREEIAEVGKRWRSHLEDRRSVSRAWLARARSVVADSGAPVARQRAESSGRCGRAE